MTVYSAQLYKEAPTYYSVRRDLCGNLVSSTFFAYTETDKLAEEVSSSYSKLLSLGYPMLPSLQAAPSGGEIRMDILWRLCIAVCMYIPQCQEIQQATTHQFLIISIHTFHLNDFHINVSSIHGLCWMLINSDYKEHNVWHPTGQSEQKKNKKRFNRPLF